MSILDKYPPPWTENGDDVIAANGEKVIRTYGDVGLDWLAYDDTKPLVLAAPELLAALRALYEAADMMVDEMRFGFVPPKAIDEARALIARIEKP